MITRGLSDIGLTHCTALLCSILSAVILSCKELCISSDCSALYRRPVMLRCGSAKCLIQCALTYNYSAQGMEWQLCHLLSCTIINTTYAMAVKLKRVKPDLLTTCSCIAQLTMFHIPYRFCNTTRTRQHVLQQTNQQMTWQSRSRKLFSNNTADLFTVTLDFMTTYTVCNLLCQEAHWLQDYTICWLYHPTSCKLSVAHYYDK